MSPRRGFGVLLLLFLGAGWAVTTLRPAPRLVYGGCGPRSLYAAGRALGLSVTEGQVSRLFADGRGLSSFAEIQRAANALGLRAEGRQMTGDDLRRAHPLGILHIDNTHFVALLGCGADAVQVADPAYEGEPRRETWSYADLAGRWDGRILVVERR